VSEALKGLETNDQGIDAEGLLMKFFGHASSIWHLVHGTEHHGIADIPKGTNFIDAGSINVLARAALETFLVHHYLFIDPQEREEKNFRYTSWIVAGLLDRQNYPVLRESSRQKLEKERVLIASMQEKLRNNPYYIQLSRRQRSRLINGKWRFKSWKEIGLSAGLNYRHAEHFYKHLCGYAHANSLSVLQIRDAKTVQNQMAICTASLNLVMIAMANMINAYTVHSSEAKKALEARPESKNLVDQWVEIGASELPNLD